MESNLQEMFSNDLNSNLHIKTDLDTKVLNYSWINLFEEVIPYLDNIIRNPRKFIVNEEEIVLVEKSKKVTVESVIHLTQHTNLIEKFDEDTGEVRPTKILNINKEESMDTYENRFIYTLIKNMQLFYMRHSKAYFGGGHYIDSKLAEYEANTKVGEDKIKMNIKFTSLNNQKEDIPVDKNGVKKEPVDERLKKIKNHLDGIANSELITTLDRLHVSQVTSPIRKTNAILKNPNFQKATELWNFIQLYDSDDVKQESTSRDYMDTGNIKKQFDNSFMFNYLAMSTLSKNNTLASERKALALTLASVIESILDIDDKILEEKVSQVFSEEFKTTKKAVEERNAKIISQFNEKLKKCNDQARNALSLLE